MIDPNIIHYNPLGQTEKELAIENYHVEFENVQTAWSSLIVDDGEW